MLRKKNLFFNLIPKNASTFVSTHLIQLGWNFDNSILPEDTIKFVILRDPYQRYISGLLEEIQQAAPLLQKQIINSIMVNNNWFLDWLTHFRSFDIGPHTNLQIRYYTVDYNIKTVFFNLDDHINNKLHNWLVEQGVPNNFLNLMPLNVKKTGALYRKVNDYFTNSYTNNSKLLEYLQPDYDFINSINFI